MALLLLFPFPLTDRILGRLLTSPVHATCPYVLQS